MKQLLNPCDHVMSQHLGFANELVEKRSPQENFNIDLLRLNNTESTLYRKDTIECASLLVERIIGLKGTESEREQNGIDRAVMILSKLTYHSEEKIRKVLKV